MMVVIIFVQDALETLEKQADFLGGDQNASRALAFRKASAALKALPRPVRSMREVENLNDLKGGKHCKRLIQVDLVFLVL